jgi:O-acetyl-ADP-ribose deacetylase (regulator of RNase III)
MKVEGSMKCFKLPDGRIIAVVQGDITRVSVDAIVNPANTLMIMGGGVAGAIKRAGGDEIEREAMRRAPLPIGEAITTTAGKLPSKYVIHAPTVERPGSPSNPRFVELATKASLRVAVEMKLQSIALPALGAGVGGLDVRESSEIMAKVVRESLSPNLVVFIARDAESLAKMELGVRRVLNIAPEDCQLEIFKASS